MQTNLVSDFRLFQMPMILTCEGKHTRHGNVQTIKAALDGSAKGYTLLLEAQGKRLLLMTSEHCLGSN